MPRCDVDREIDMPRTRSLIQTVSLATGLLVLGTVWVFTATQNVLPKYAANGALVDSVVSEQAGRVGIGAASVEGRLEVKSAGVNSSPIVARNSANTNKLFEIVEGSAGNANLYVYTVSGSQAVAMSAGASSPRVEVKSASTNSSPLIVRNSANANALFEILEGNGGHSNLYLYKLDGTKAVAIASSNDNSYFAGAGNVGIGTTTPTAKLHVAGNVVVDGNIGAKYQDVAEWVEATEPLDAGTVVVVDDNSDNRVTASRRAYDLAVAGVVSPTPGVILGEPGTRKALVAHSGRVRMKADAGYGAIRRGDLLVSSATKGYAMRSTPMNVGGARVHRPGSVLGKALEPLASGRGDILVLLTLQ